jgi:hypothetical protein
VMNWCFDLHYDMHIQTLPNLRVPFHKASSSSSSLCMLKVDPLSTRHTCAVTHVTGETVRQVQLC